jgi:hypothetical protein
MHEDNRVEALKSLEYYQGHKQNGDLILNEMLKESIDTHTHMTVLQSISTVFRRQELRKATQVGIACIQVYFSFKMFSMQSK